MRGIPHLAVQEPGVQISEPPIRTTCLVQTGDGERGEGRPQRTVLVQEETCGAQGMRNVV